MELQDNWVTVTKRQKRTKPNKYIDIVYRIPNDADKTITDEEKQMLKKVTLKNGCFCCNAPDISDIICRTVVGCGECYCCIGEFSDINLNDSPRRFYVYNPDYSYDKRRKFR